MQYKFEFIQDDYVPEEYLHRDLERRKQYGWDQIIKMISEHYPFATIKRPDGTELHSISLVCCSTRKFNQAMESIFTALSFRPELRSLVKEIIDQMFYPETEEEK